MAAYMRVRVAYGHVELEQGRIESCPNYSQPRSSAMRRASIRFRPAVLAIDDER
jgi:hypothetical protein